MDKTALNAQLVTTGVKGGLYHLKSVDCGRSDLWKRFGCQWKKWIAWFCWWLDLSSGVMIRASLGVVTSTGCAEYSCAEDIYYNS